ncbi:hypothetical protein M404DRAFT_17535 [Pisolithus tinctorius Marx 270]|uniref:Myb/SANT-like domain-containing protein n=1 Tax=Pisolithus tinctorius Marx 270 TaxID=870435 RepID=A0A0C3PYF7_PISTI|nr:hypothetical protein M404DRAFT_17535 [Pisolithus tinctorius Marx 270]
MSLPPYLTSADTRHNHIWQVLIELFDVLGSNIVELMETVGEIEEESKHAKWTDEEVAALIDYLHTTAESICKLHRSGKIKDSKNVLIKWGLLKHTYNAIMTYRSGSGEHWDNENGANICGAADAEKWAKFIGVKFFHPTLLRLIPTFPVLYNSAIVSEIYHPPLESLSVCVLRVREFLESNNLLEFCIPIPLFPTRLHLPRIKSHGSRSKFPTASKPFLNFSFHTAPPGTILGNSPFTLPLVARFPEVVFHTGPSLDPSTQKRVSSDDGPGDDGLGDDLDNDDEEPLPEDDVEPGVTVLDNLANAIELLTRNARTGSELSSRTKLHKPDTFDGTDPKKLRAFLIQCKLNFWDRPQAF